MARENYGRSLAAVLRWEGGYVNHPKDPGGATMQGVTQKVFDAYCDRAGAPRRPVKEITEAEVRKIYKRQYWDVICGDDLPMGLDFALFDFAVNSGPTRAVRVLQGILGQRQDGDMGAVTINAATEADQEDLIAKLCGARLAFMRGLSGWSTFGKGWQSRVSGVRQQATAMVPHRTARAAALDDIGLPDVDEDEDQTPRATAFADPREMKVASTVTGKGAIASGIGTAGAAVSDLTQQIEPLSYYSDTLRWIFLGLLGVGASITIYGVVRSIRRQDVA